jgi:flagellar basal body-associated protein FliL
MIFLLNKFWRSAIFLNLSYEYQNNAHKSFLSKSQPELQQKIVEYFAKALDVFGKVDDAL